MEESVILERKFHGSDANMIVSARTNYSLFFANLTDFTNFDGTLDADWATDYLDAVVAAENLTTDNLVIDQVAEKTENVTNALLAARNKYGEVKYFAQKAISSKVILNQFGLNDYEEARRSAPTMLIFLKQLHTAAVTYQTQLVAVGYTAAKITEIMTIHDALSVAYEEQDEAMKARPVATQDRIVVLNTCYKKMTEVNAAAQFVYEGDAARQAQFVFEPSSQAFDGPGVYDGIIAGGASVEAAHIHYKAERTLIFENTGATPLQFWLNGGGLGTQGTVIDVAAHTVHPTLTMADLDATGNHVIVKNLDTEAAGNYKVTVGLF